MERTARQKARASHSSSTTVGRRVDGCCVDDDALVIGAVGLDGGHSAVVIADLAI